MAQDIANVKFYRHVDIPVADIVAQGLFQKLFSGGGGRQRLFKLFLSGGWIHKSSQVKFVVRDEDVQV